METEVPALFKINPASASYAVNCIEKNNLGR